MKGLVRYLILPACCLLSAASAYAQGISVAPTRLFFSGMPGQTITEQLALTNIGKAPVILKASFKEWKRDSLGNKVYYDSGSLATSNIAWMQVMQDVVEIAPGARKEVTVVMRVPDDSLARNAVTNCMLFYTQINEQKAITQTADGKQIGIKIRLEVGIHVYHTPPGFTRRDIDFIAFDDRGVVPKGADSVRRLALKIRNTGEVVMDGEVRFELTDKASGEDMKFNGARISLIPGTEQLVYLDLPPNMTGRKYLAIALLDSGSETNLKVAEKEISYKH